MRVTAEEFMERWEDNQECMGEMAAFDITCDEFQITQQDAFDILAEAGEE